MDSTHFADFADLSEHSERARNPAVQVLTRHTEYSP